MLDCDWSSDVCSSDLDFALMAGELARLFEDLLVALGGEIRPA
jgi:DNA recombination-dependent growth factor C